MRICVFWPLLFATLCRAQTYAPAPRAGCDSYTMGQAPVLTFAQKSCYYRDGLFTGSAVFSALFFAGVAQLRHDPSAWPQGAQGFGQRLGTRYTQGLAKNTAQYLFGALSHEDPRSRPPANPACPDHLHAAKTGIWPRTGSALLRTVWIHGDDCKDRPAYSRIAGSLASGFVGIPWTPDPGNTYGAAFRRSGSAMGGYFAASVFNEFQGDLFHAVSSIFGKGKSQP